VFANRPRIHNTAHRTAFWNTLGRNVLGVFFALHGAIFDQMVGELLSMDCMGFPLGQDSQKACSTSSKQNHP